MQKDPELSSKMFAAINHIQHAIANALQKEREEVMNKVAIDEALSCLDFLIDDKRVVDTAGEDLQPCLKSNAKLFRKAVMNCVYT